MAAREPGYFLDTSFVVALLGSDDAYHQAATAWMAWLKQRQTLLLTHEGILTEIGDGFSRPSRRKLGIDILGRLCSDPSIEIVPLDATLRTRALALYCSRPDKDWGLTDCASFVLMSARAVTAALTTDQHFVQAGFHALLTEEPPG